MTFRAAEYLERWRVPLHGELGDEQNGSFIIKPNGLTLIMSNGGGWEHVSLSRRSRDPSYQDMCFAKANCWSDEDTVMQLHVPAPDHVNFHEHCLHLWRPISQKIPRPPIFFVGPQSNE